jgi:hypothetical protein
VGEWLHTSCRHLEVLNICSVQDRFREDGLKLMTHVLPKLMTLNANDCILEGNPGRLVNYTPQLERLSFMWCTFEQNFDPPSTQAQLQKLKVVKIVSAQTTPNLHNILGPAVTHLDLGHMNTTDNLQSITSLLTQDKIKFIQIRKTSNQAPTTEAVLAQAVTRNHSLRCFLYRGAKQGETWLRVIRKRRDLQAVSFLRNCFGRCVLLAMLRTLVQVNYATRVNLSTLRTTRMPDITSTLANNKLTYLSLRNWVFTRNNFERVKHFANTCYIKHLSIGEGKVYQEISTNTRRIYDAIMAEISKYINSAVSSLVCEYAYVHI